MPGLLQRLLPKRRQHVSKTAGSVEEEQASSKKAETEGGEVDLCTLIQEENNSHQAVLWVKAFCPYCEAAKDLLQREMKGMDVVIHDLSEAPRGQLVMEELERQTGQKTVPMVFIAGKAVGGNSDLQELYHSDELEKLLFPDIADGDQKFRAVWKGTVLAESDETIVVRGSSYYFPPQSIRRNFFKDSDHTSVCGWKGEATYFDLKVKGKKYRNGAWVYSDPLDEAKHFKEYISFDEGVAVMKGRETLRTKI